MADPSIRHSVAKRPCGSCPYRCDVPSGLWERDEYEKLPRYDGDTGSQSPAIFLCHQRDGNLCAGWVACHGDGLLALRLGAFAGTVDPAVFGYETDVPVFASGREAMEHGCREIERPGAAARKKIAGLLRKKDAA